MFCKPDTLIQNPYNPQNLNHYMFERGNPYRNTDEDGHLVWEAVDYYDFIMAYDKYLKEPSRQNKKNLLFAASGLIPGIPSIKNLQRGFNGIKNFNKYVDKLVKWADNWFKKNKDRIEVDELNKADDKKPDFFVTQKGTATDSLKTPGGQVMSDHALDQMSKRGINPSQVDNTISKGEKFDYIQHESVPVNIVEQHLATLLNEKGGGMDEATVLLIGRHLQRIRFYLKLEAFGYELHLKPVKLYDQDNGTTKRKANCDVDMAFWLMREQRNFDRTVILSGDGDFLPVLKYLKDEGKEVLILARGPRTAREIRQFAGGNFKDFVRLEKYIKFNPK